MNRQVESGDRVIYAISAGKLRTPFLEQLSKYQSGAAITRESETKAATRSRSSHHSPSHLNPTKGDRPRKSVEQALGDY